MCCGVLQCVLQCVATKLGIPWHHLQCGTPVYGRHYEKTHTALRKDTHCITKRHTLHYEKTHTALRKDCVPMWSRVQHVWSKVVLIKAADTHTRTPAQIHTHQRACTHTQMHTRMRCKSADTRHMHMYTFAHANAHADPQTRTHTL